MNLALAVAVAYPAALFALWFPDLRPFLVSVMRTLFFLAPGLVPLSQIYGYTDDVLKANPLTGLFESYRAVLQYGEAPEWLDARLPAGVRRGDGRRSSSRSTGAKRPISRRCSSDAGPPRGSGRAVRASTASSGR